MKIVFFSSNSNHFTKNSMTISTIPSCKEQWNLFGKNHPDDEFIIILQKPGMFLLDSQEILTDEGTDFSPACNVHFKFIKPEEESPEMIAQKIISEAPDSAASITYWTNPFDWLSIKDGLIAEILRKKGIKTFAHGSTESLICFDKTQTHNFLKNNGFKVAKAVEVHHELFYAERNRLEIKSNVYKEYIFQKIQELNFPVVIKDTMGLSSFGMDVCKTFPETKHVLTSKKNNGDRLVEEFLQGDSFGAEIYGNNGNYVISPVLINSVNQFGLTSPKQNVKLGPVTEKRFNIPFLQNELKRLASLLNFSGIAQVDLIFKDNTWYIIEINSRISGMTETIAASLGLSLYELIYSATCGFDKNHKKLEELCKNPSFTMNMKFPILSEDKLQALYKMDFIECVNQIENHEAKQLREAGYSEIIFGKAETLSEILEKLEIIKNTFPEEIESIFYHNALKLAQCIE